MLFSPMKTKNRTNLRFSILVQKMHRTYFLSPSLFIVSSILLFIIAREIWLSPESKERTYGIEKKKQKSKFNDDTIEWQL